MEPVDLFGRSRECEELEAHLPRLSGGHGATVGVIGAGGSGKTALIDAVIAEAEALGIARLVDRAGPLSRFEPYALVDRLLGLEAERSGELPSDAAFDRIERAVELIAHTPTLVVAEDLHWADAGSIAVLGALARRTSSDPILLMMSWRPDGSTTPVEVDLDARIDLGPISDDAGRRLAEHIVNAVLGPHLSAAISNAGGSPLMIEQLVSQLRAIDAITIDGGIADIAPEHVPEGRGDTLNVWADLLDDQTLLAVRAVAILGMSADPSDVAAVLDQPTALVATALDRASAAGLLIPDGSSYGFHHDLVRESLYLHTPEPLRAVLHREAASHTAAQRLPSSVTAAHLALGAEPGDEAAIEWLRSTAGDVRRAAPAAALELLDATRGLAPDDRTRETIERARLDVLIELGEVGEAAVLARSLVDLAGDHQDIVESGALVSRAAGLLSLQRRGDECVELLDDAIATLAGHPVVTARLLAQRALTKIAVVDHAGSAADAEAALDLAGDVHDPVAESMAQSVAGRLGTFRHDYQTGLEPGMRSVLAADLDGSGEAHLHMPLFHYGLSALDVDDHRAALRAAARGREVARAYGMTWSLPFFAGVEATVHYRRGALDDAWIAAHSGLGIAHDTGSLQAEMWCEAFCSLVARHQGDPDGADRHAQAAHEAWERDSSPLGVDLMALASAAALETGSDQTAAFEGLAGAWDIFAALGVGSCQPLLGVPLVRLAGRVGDDERATSTAGALTDIAATSELESHRAIAAWAVGLVERDAELVHEAGRRFARVDRHLEAAGCLADVARLTATASDLEAAVSALRSLGADGTERALVDELAGQQGPTGRATFGWSSLTPTERAIVRLVAEGRSNAEIATARAVSRRTVESHLARVYTKLGFSSRVRLAIEAGDHLEPEPT